MMKALAIILSLSSLAEAETIRSQQITRDGIVIKTTDQRTITITKDDIIAFFNTRTGTDTERRTQTRDGIRQTLEDELTSRVISASRIVVDFDATFNPTLLEIHFGDDR